MRNFMVRYSRIFSSSFINACNKTQLQYRHQTIIIKSAFSHLIQSLNIVNQIKLGFIHCQEMLYTFYLFMRIDIY